MTTSAEHVRPGRSAARPGIDRPAPRLVRLPGVYRPQEDTALLAAAIGDLEIPAGARALDLCTGTGAQAITLARRGAGSVVAVDLSRRALASVRPTRSAGASASARAGAASPRRSAKARSTSSWPTRRTCRPRRRRSGPRVAGTPARTAARCWTRSARPRARSCGPVGRCCWCSPRCPMWSDRGKRSRHRDSGPRWPGAPASRSARSCPDGPRSSKRPG